LINAIKRLDMDKDHPLVMNSSPTKADGSASQILSLAEALQATRRELEGQSNRVKALEESLKQERQARETAEERARHLLEYSKVILVSGSTSEQPSDQPQFDTTAPFRDVSASDSVSEADSEASQETIAPSSMRDIDQVEERTNTGTPSVNELQNQLDLMRMEMQDMKLQMEEYKHRAEQSEQRAAQAEDEKTSLVVMVEKLRAEQQKSQAASHSREPSGSSSSSIPILGDFTNGTAGPSSQQAGAHSKDGSRGANGSASESQQQMQQLQSAVVQALSKQQQDNHLAQSAPFASMLGVVLIGVGLMTYLNGWPKADH
jgi:phage shock protein A